MYIIIRSGSIIIKFKVYGEIKATPVQALVRLSGLGKVETPRICGQSAHEGGKVSPTHRLPVPPHPRREDQQEALYVSGKLLSVSGKLYL
jgi:hypothetical protein